MKITPEIEAGIQKLRGLAQATSHNERMEKAFHRRYNPKPIIKAATTADGVNIRIFKTDTKEAEYIEFQKDGLTDTVVIYIKKKLFFARSVLEAEIAIVDYLGET